MPCALSYTIFWDLSHDHIPSTWPLECTWQSPLLRLKDLHPNILIRDHNIQISLKKRCQRQIFLVNVNEILILAILFLFSNCKLVIIKSTLPRSCLYINTISSPCSQLVIVKSTIPRSCLYINFFSLLSSWKLFGGLSLGSLKGVIPPNHLEYRV